jgi:hypothetical protein
MLINNLQAIIVIINEMVAMLEEGKAEPWQEIYKGKWTKYSCLKMSRKAAVFPKLHKMLI